jgi:hypothetical protein
MLMISVFRLDDLKTLYTDLSAIKIDLADPIRQSMRCRCRILNAD